MRKAPDDRAGTRSIGGRIAGGGLATPRLQTSGFEVNGVGQEAGWSKLVDVAGLGKARGLQGGKEDRHGDDLDSR